MHYGSPLWVEIQSRHLREHISVPYRTWASLQAIDPSYATHFDRVIDQAGSHSDKLNHLAIEIMAEASGDDLMMFLDGDAFPIADPLPLIAEGLAKAPLIAVRRVENAGDLQPHPCFCVTTVNAWRELSGDWSQGYRWVNTQGESVSDIGGNLLRKLELTETPWVEVLRSNRKNLDPVFFGVYGDTVYHHGAGFRGFAQLTRLHVALAPEPQERSGMPVVRGALHLKDRVQRHVWFRGTRRRLTRLSNTVIAKIQRGDQDWLAEFI